MKKGKNILLCIAEVSKCLSKVSKRTLLLTPYALRLMPYALCLTPYALFLFLTFVTLSLSKCNCSAQGVAINSLGSAADNSAMLDVSSTTRGLLVPRMTQVQRNAIASPVTSLLIYQTDGIPGYYYYNGATWVAFSIHSQLHAMSSVADHSATAWQLFYSNGSGIVTELSFGSAGTVLKSNGIAAAPAWQADNNSGGTVTGSGSATQIAFWSSGSALSGDNGLWWDNTNKRLGIGTVSPSTRLHVYQTSPSIDKASYIQFVPNLTATQTSNLHAAWNTVLSGSSFNNSADLYGAVNRIETTPSQTGSIQATFGSSNDVYNYGTGTIGFAFGSQNNVNNQSAGTITAAYGLRTNIQNLAGGSITNGFGIYIDNIQASNKWSIYANDASAPSYFSGNVGIGDVSPASLLTVGNGDLFQINSSGNIIKINNVNYSWPASQASGTQVLQNNGSGTLSWATPSSGTVTSSCGVVNYIPKMSSGTNIACSQIVDNGSQVQIATTSIGGKFNVDGGGGGQYAINGQVSGAGVGVVGNNSSSGVGVLGQTGTGNGVQGSAAGATGIGVAGYGGKWGVYASGINFDFFSNNISSFGNVHIGTGAQQGIYADGTNLALRGFNVAGGGIYFQPYGGGSTSMYIANSTGRVGIGSTTPGGQLELSLDQGRKPGTNTWTIVSDERLKNIEGAYTKGLNEILQLHPITYHYKNPALSGDTMSLSKGVEGTGERKFADEVLSTLNVGFSAQDVQKIFPEAVGTDDDGYLNFNMHSILVAYVNAIKEQQQQIEKLQSENQNLKAEIIKQQTLNIKQETLNNEIRTELELLKRIVGISAEAKK